MNWYGYEPKEKRYFVNLNEKPVKRTPYAYPYNYDDYVIWKDETFDAKNHSAVYSDRLMQWDYTKFTKCCKEVFKNESQLFSQRDPKEIEKFLCMYFDKKVRLTAITQGCNQASGFPYWVFYFEEN